MRGGGIARKGSHSLRKSTNDAIAFATLPLGLPEVVTVADDRVLISIDFAAILPTIQR